MKRLLLFVALIAWSGMAGAVVYKWIDAQGRSCNTATVRRTCMQRWSLLGTHVARAAQTRSADAAQAARTNRDSATTDGRAKKAVDSDVERRAPSSARRRRIVRDCGDAASTRPADGERQYLTSEEIDSERLNAKQELDTICNSSN